MASTPDVRCQYISRKHMTQCPASIRTIALLPAQREHAQHFSLYGRTSHTKKHNTLYRTAAPRSATRRKITMLPGPKRKDMTLWTVRPRQRTKVLYRTAEPAMQWNYHSGSLWRVANTIKNKGLCALAPGNDAAGSTDEDILGLNVFV